MRVEVLTRDVIEKVVEGDNDALNDVSLDDEEILNFSVDESTTDSLKQYYREINQYKVLTREEEIELFKRYKNNDKESYNILVNSNLKLVVFVARKYIGNGLDLQDLIQEGNIGLINAINRFDYTKECKFSTYAIYLIRQKITHAINDKGRTIRLPNGLIEKKLNIINQIKKFNTLYGCDPTIDELSSLLNYSKEQIEKIMNCSEVVSSLNAPISEDNEVELQYYIKDDKVDILSELLNNELSDNIRKILDESKLKPRDKRVLELRFGLADGTVHTLDDISKIFGVTRQRVQQIIVRSLRKLRTNMETKNLAVYTDDSKKSLEFLNKAILFNLENKLLDPLTYILLGEENKLNEKKGNYMKKSTNNLIEYFNRKFIYEELVKAIEQLEKDDKDEAYFVCGDKLDGNSKEVISKEKRQHYNSYVLTKIKRRLKSLYPDKKDFADGTSLKNKTIAIPVKSEKKNFVDGMPSKNKTVAIPAKPERKDDFSKIYALKKKL
jgi:RNA polymerase primary sigma factor